MHSGRERRQFRGASRLGRFGGLLAALSLVLAGCSGPQSMLDTAGTGARESASVWWLMFWLGTAVFILVMGILWYAVARAGKDRGDDGSPEPSGKSHKRLVILGGVVLPVIVIAVVFAFSTRGLMAIGDLRGGEDVTIDVVAHQYWWEVSYPDEGFVTANEIHIPVDKSVELRLTSNDVIHSFFVPSLHGKIDMMPGHTTTISLKAEKPGTYRGQCAQFCGVQHANMAFTVVVHENDSYQAWVEHQQQPASTVPDDERIARGQDVFMSSSCVYCHTVSGTAANGTLGPDLTHLGSRETLASGTLANTRGNLAAWIVDPQAIKPGNLMPGITLSGEDLDLLLDYLESLD